MAKNSGFRVLWVWVILAFAVLAGAWMALINVASKNAPEDIPIEGKG